MPRYRYIYEGFQHGERHPNDRVAVEVVNEAMIARGLLRVERLLPGVETRCGGSSPQCRDGVGDSAVEVVWERETSGGGE